MFMLLKMVILLKSENLIKGNQSNEYIVSIIFKEKMHIPSALWLLFFVFFLVIQGAPLSTSPYFWSKKYIAFSSSRNCMYKRDMEFRPFYLIVRHFVCNLIYSSPVSHFYTPWKRRFQGVYKCDTGLKWVKNSVITHFKVLIISIADWRMFWWWIETKLCTKSIFIKYLSITAGPYQ